MSGAIRVTIRDVPFLLRSFSLILVPSPNPVPEGTFTFTPALTHIIKAIRRFSFAFVSSSLHGHLDFVTSFLILPLPFINMVNSDAVRRR